MKKQDTRTIKPRDPNWRFMREMGHKVVPNKKAYSRKGKAKWQS